MDLRRLGILAAMDLLLLGELVFSIWMSVEDMTSVASTFCLWFVPMATATVMGARLALRKLALSISWDDFKPVGIMGPFKEGASPFKARN